ncbi:MAG TPA: hypothetical protein VGB85_32335, partial [Nannocystis sp.]|jgi:hypothetical protein
VHEAASGPESPAIAAPAVRAGQLAAAAGELAEAQALLERGLSLTTGRKDQVDLRRAAALALARTLVGAGTPGARACALAGEAGEGLAADDPRRGEVEALRALACTP